MIEYVSHVKDIGDNFCRVLPSFSCQAQLIFTFIDLYVWCVCVCMCVCIYVYIAWAHMPPCVCNVRRQPRGVWGSKSEHRPWEHMSLHPPCWSSFIKEVKISAFDVRKYPQWDLLKSLFSLSHPLTALVLLLCCRLVTLRHLSVWFPALDSWSLTRCWDGTLWGFEGSCVENRVKPEKSWGEGMMRQL